MNHAPGYYSGRHLIRVLEGEAKVWQRMATAFGTGVALIFATTLAVVAWTGGWPATPVAFLAYTTSVVAAGGIAHEFARWRAARFMREAQQVRREIEQLEEVSP